jgi:CMP-2-keto-3-deoxyoctulosonic acid synthetase
MNKHEVLKNALVAREQEIMGYQINIDNYTLAIEHIQTSGDADLADFCQKLESLLASEKLEQLRYLEYGKRIKMVETTHGSIGIDTEEDLEKARKLL